MHISHEFNNSKSLKYLKTYKACELEKNKYMYIVIYYYKLKLFMCIHYVGTAYLPKIDKNSVSSIKMWLFHGTMETQVGP